jgi:glutamyl-tRNA synthetase
VALGRGVALGKLAQPIRLAVCGGTISPPIDATLEILGREESLSRLRQAQGLWGAV